MGYLQDPSAEWAAPAVLDGYLAWLDAEPALAADARSRAPALFVALAGTAGKSADVSGGGALDDAPGVGCRTPACLRGQRELRERFHTLPRACQRDADCTMVRLRCSAEANCGYPVRQSGDTKHAALRTLDRELARDCGPCVSESVSCPARAAVCREGRFVGAGDAAD